MQLRAKIAPSLEAHMSPLAQLVGWGALAECRLVRAALVRLCVRAGSIGGGMGPFLAPLVGNWLHCHSMLWPVPYRTPAADCLEPDLPRHDHLLVCALLSLQWYIQWVLVMR